VTAALGVIVASWMVLAGLGVANGILRELVLTPRLGARALPLSGVILAVLIFMATVVMQPWWAGQASAGVVGGLWLTMTVTFECAFGRMRGASWKKLLRAYAFAGGDLWSVDLLVIALAPWLANALRGT
jgi:hypothetical protein